MKKITSFLALVCLFVLNASAAVSYELDQELTWDDVKRNKWHVRRYRMQSKVILVVTACLILLPAIYFYFCEFGRRACLWYNQWRKSFFFECRLCYYGY